MTNNFNKNFKLLSLFSLCDIEKYLNELVNLSFEYSSLFVFSYSYADFKNIPLNVFSNSKNEDSILNKFLHLLNVYLEKDSFFSSLFVCLNLKLKIKFNQFMQIIGLRGGSGIKNFNSNILSNLNDGLTFKDFILSSFKTRESIIDSSVNISSSGYLTRKLVEGLRSFTIKEIKCSSKYSYIDLIYDKFINTPFLCSSNKSVCSFCLNSSIKNAYISGFNKGVISGQALGEPSTQMLLRTFHLGADNIEVSGDQQGVYYSSYKNYKFYADNCVEPIKAFKNNKIVNFNINNSLNTSCFADNTVGENTVRSCNFKFSVIADFNIKSLWSFTCFNNNNINYINVCQNKSNKFKNYYYTIY